MDASTKKELDRIVDAIRNNIEVSEIYLFWLLCSRDFSI